MGTKILKLGILATIVLVAAVAISVGIGGIKQVQVSSTLQQQSPRPQFGDAVIGQKVSLEEVLG